MQQTPLDLNKVTTRGGSVSITGANDRILDLLRVTQLDHVVTLLPGLGHSREKS